MFNTKKSLIAIALTAGVTSAYAASNPALKGTKTPVINPKDIVVEHKGDTWKYTNLITGEVVTYKGDPKKYLDPKRIAPYEKEAQKKHADKGIFAWREALKNRENDYSAEVPDSIDGGNAGDAECTIPNAFAAVHIKAAQTYKAPHTYYGYGTPITEEAIKPWNIDVDAAGRGLPPKGVGMTLEDGEAVYQAYCSMCHGEFGESAKGYLPLVGDWSLVTDDDFGPAPFRSIGNYWPYLTTAFDYIRRTMPFWAPNNPAIGDAGYMGIVGFLTDANQIPVDDEGNLPSDVLGEDGIFDSEMLMKANAHMNNQKNFFCDDRPVVHQPRCMSNCPDEVVGDGKGNIHNYRGPKLLPDGTPQYNTGPDAQQRGPRYAGTGREPAEE